MDTVSSKAGSSEKQQKRCSRCGKIVIYIGIVEAMIFVVLKVTFGLASGSRALVAASLYSMQDLISSLVAAIGLKISGRPPDHNHPYGHGKVEYLVVVLMSVMILLGVIALAVTSLAGLFGGVSAAEAPTMMALWLALVCGMACWLLAHFQGCAGKRLNSPALKSCATHMHSDYIASIAVVVSVIGARLGYPALDHIVAIVEAVHVVFVSGRMLGSAVNGLMDAAAEPNLIEKLKRLIGEIKSVRVRKATAGWAGQTLMARLDVEVPGNMGVKDADELRTRIQQTVKTRLCEHSETLVRILPAQ
ncbi:MAG: cation transporter [Planctomycetota bacterium]|nr:MAG: cation transporter [Planctomycetota bacterium]